MKLFVYAMRTFDELGYFTELCEAHGIELGWTEDELTLQTAELAAGSDAVAISPRTVDRPILTRLRDLGVKAICAHSIGVDHIDFDAARDLGLSVSHASYEPDSVADFSIMLMLMSLRRMTQTMDRARVQDYSLRGKIGRNISHLTVGVVSTGRIGGTVISHLKGFGCKLLAYDIRPSEEVAANATYVDMDTLLRESDVVSLHAPATPDNYHMIDARAISLMKDDAVLVNTGRGTLIDTDALIDALEAGKFTGVALDVLEHEDGLYYYNRVGDCIANRQMAILRSFPNVLLTPHSAFYTDVNVRQMAETVVEAAYALLNGLDNDLILVR